MIRKGTRAARALVARGFAQALGGFALALARPVGTMGGPAFGTPMPQRRRHGDGPVFVADAAGVPGAMVSGAIALGARRLALFWLALGRLIRHGDLIRPHDEALAAHFRLWRFDARG